MIWHIAKRELYDNLNSLRFALATFLLLALMLTNAVVHLREHPERIQEYRTSVTDYWNALEENLPNQSVRACPRGAWISLQKTPLR